MIIAETIYTVGNFKFDNFKDAERFNIYLDLGYFNDEQLTKLYMGYKNKIDYTIYANPKFNVYQMGRIYTVKLIINHILILNLILNKWKKSELGLE